MLGPARTAMALAVTCSLLAATAGSAAPAGRLKPEVSAAAPGVALNLRGSGLTGTRTRVTVGGKRARVLAGNRRRVRIVVPALAPGTRKVVAVAKRRRLVGRLRVLAPFRGTIKARADARRTASATIGAAGGTVAAKAANGTAYALEIPAGAVTADTTISVTPVTRFDGLPFTRGSAAGVVFGPARLALAAPATLRITYPRRAPSRAVGFTFDSTSGRSFAVAEAKPAGNRTVAVPVSHFSGAGSSRFNSQDFARFVQSELDRLRTRRLTLGQTEHLASLLVRWAALDRAGFCINQPVCVDAATIVLDNLARLVGEACPPPPAALPSVTLSAIHDMFRIESLRQMLDGVFTSPIAPAHDANACAVRILDELVENAKAGLVQYSEGRSVTGPGGPLSVPVESDQLGLFPGLRARRDLDRDGRLVYIEWLLFLADVGQLLGSDRTDAIQPALLRSLESIFDEGTDVCNEDLDRGRELLIRGRSFAEALILLEQDWAGAIGACVPKVVMTPATSSLETGQAVTLRARANFTDPLGPISYAWEATGGSVTPGPDSAQATYTAPDEPGQFTVTATTPLLVRYQVSGTATVTVSCAASSRTPQCEAPTGFATVTGREWNLQVGAQVGEVCDPECDSGAFDSKADFPDPGNPLLAGSDPVSLAATAQATSAGGATGTANATLDGSVGISTGEGAFSFSYDLRGSASASATGRSADAGVNVAQYEIRFTVDGGDIPVRCHDDSENATFGLYPPPDDGVLESGEDYRLTAHMQLRAFFNTAPTLTGKVDAGCTEVEPAP